MLILDIPRLCNERSITNPKKLLLSLGFYPKATTDLLSRKRVRVDYDQIEKLCIALRCTPNDLFSWHPGKDTHVDATHPMKALIHPPKTNIVSLLQGMSTEQIDEVRAMMEAKLAAV